MKQEPLNPEPNAEELQAAQIGIDELCGPAAENLLIDIYNTAQKNDELGINAGLLIMEFCMSHPQFHVNTTTLKDMLYHIAGGREELLHRVIAAGRKAKEGPGIIGVENEKKIVKGAFVRQ